jgi:hypothetical protein
MPRERATGKPTSAPVFTIDDVSVWALGGERFRVVGPLFSRELRGYKLAVVVAQETARKLRERPGGRHD